MCIYVHICIFISVSRWQIMNSKSGTFCGSVSLVRRPTLAELAPITELNLRAKSNQVSLRQRFLHIWHPTIHPDTDPKPKTMSATSL